MASELLLSDTTVVSYVEATINELHNDVLNQHQQQIIQYFEDRPELNFSVLRKKLKRKKQFAAEITKHCNGNKKVKGAVIKLLRHLQTKIKSMSDEEMSASESEASSTRDVSITPRNPSVPTHSGHSTRGGVLKLRGPASKLYKRSFPFNLCICFGKRIVHWNLSQDFIICVVVGSLAG